MNYTEQKIAETLETNYMPYAMSVIVSRAIPEIDGFKPAHRKLLYTMYKMGLINGKLVKSANIVGQTMKLNPHGDSAIYETMVRLTEGNASLLHPLVESKGNFGKHYSRNMAYAASRYTEAKLGSICKELFDNIDKDAVDFQDNYDATMKEPTLLPVTFPNILVNPNEGIAVGMASKICSFNLREICDTTIALLRDENHDVLTTLKAPDFPGGAQLLYDEDALREIYKTGKGSFKLRSKYNFDKKNGIIEVTEIPYSTNVEAIIDKIVEGIKGGKYKEITDVRDETDIHGLKIAIDVKRSTDVDKLMMILFKNTTLQDTFSCNFNILVNSVPKVMGVREILLEWIKFRMQCVKRTLAFDLKKKQDRLHLLRGLEKILLDIDKAIEIIRNTEKDADVIPALCKGFGIDEIQAGFVAEIKLRNLNKEYILKNISEIADIEREIEDITMTLESDRRIKRVISKELETISKKYGKDRETEIITEYEQTSTVASEKFVESYPLRMFLTEQGYIKKISHASLNASLRVASEQKFKEDDKLIQEFDADNKDDLLLFTNKCNVYKLKINDIPDTKASQLGEYFANLVDIEEGERVKCIVATSDYKGYMMFGYTDGRVCKVPLLSYETKTNRKMLQKAYSAHSPLVNAVHIFEDCDFVAYGSNDKIMVFNSVMVPEKTTRSSQGVKTFNPGKRGTMIDFKTFEASGLTDSKGYRARNLPAAGSKVLTIKDKGMEQISLIDE